MKLPETITTVIGNGHVIVTEFTPDPKHRNEIMAKVTIPESLKRVMREIREFNRMFDACEGNRRRQAKRRP